jgi:hypothetical protein
MKATNDKTVLTTNDVAQRLSENGFKYEMIDDNKILVEIDKVKFSLSCSGKDVIWGLKIPIGFWIVVTLFFAAIIGLITILTEGPIFLLFLGALPTYLLYRYKPSTIRAKGKLLAFVNNNF